LERLRAERDYSQRRLAARVTGFGRPMTFTRFSRMEHQVRRCDIDGRVAIAAALGVPAQALLADAEELHPAAEEGAT
jgi:transcriptional regulator with XRE-family HTH domain